MEESELLLVAGGIPQLLLYADRILLGAVIIAQGERHLYDVVLWLPNPSEEGYSIRRDEIIANRMLECRHIKLTSLDEPWWLTIDLV